MKITQHIYSGRAWTHRNGAPNPDAHLVLVFGQTDELRRPELFESLRAHFAQAEIVLCSTGGEILDIEIYDGPAVAVGITFEKTLIRTAVVPLEEISGSKSAGAKIAAALPDLDSLRHVLVFAGGLGVNGTELSQGIVDSLPAHVSVTGGLAGDGERFGESLVGLNGPPETARVVAVGFYGDALRIGMGSLGGWDVLDEEMVVTASVGNVVSSLDGEPALVVYKRLLGPRAYGLPVTGLLYPIEIQSETGRGGVTRTLLAVDPQANTLTFAGDVPQGRRVRLMQANLDRLITAAGGAANAGIAKPGDKPEFALLISCIGRRLVLQMRAREEAAQVRKVVGPDTILAGFYSYGELSPLTPGAKCELLNQTMTITTFSEHAEISSGSGIA